MTGLAKRLLVLNLCQFLPEHSNNLANQFRFCFPQIYIAINIVLHPGALPTSIWTP